MPRGGVAHVEQKQLDFFLLVVIFLLALFVDFLSTGVLAAMENRQPDMRGQTTVMHN